MCGMCHTVCMILRVQIISWMTWNEKHLLPSLPATAAILIVCGYTPEREAAGMAITSHQEVPSNIWTIRAAALA